MSSGLFFTGAQANVAETSRPQPRWIDFNLDFIAQPVVGVGGGIEPSSSSWMQQVAAGLTLGTGFYKNRSNWTGLDHWQIQLELSQFAGNPNLNEQLGTEYPLQSLVTPTGMWITQASLERIEGNKKIDWSMNAGVIAIGNNLMEIPALDYYTNYTLDTPYNLSVIGYPIMPLSAPGAQIGIHHKKLGSLDYAYYSLNKTHQIAAALGVTPLTPKLEGSLQIFQWSMNPLANSKQTKTEEEAPNMPDPLIQLGGYISSTNLDVNSNKNLGEGTNRGIYATVTWPLPQLPIGEDNRIWISSSLSLDPDNNPLTSYTAAGLLSQGIIPGRPQDVLALGLNRNGFSRSIAPNQSYEGVVELNYKIQISERLQIQPLMQWIINPSGEGSRQTIWATGAQINLSI
ncbi:carbohydrate porin [Synechococcus sp. AH-551-A21]|nr:carbohydrate porin [Synechococcus sp. AH-551-A21]MDB4677645.1 carbohydrate porin [Synechococcus sp. AH-551-A21]